MINRYSAHRFSAFGRRRTQTRLCLPAESILGERKQLPDTVYAGLRGKIDRAYALGMPHFKNRLCATSHLLRRMGKYRGFNY